LQIFKIYPVDKKKRRPVVRQSTTDGQLPAGDERTEHQIDFNAKLVHKRRAQFNDQLTSTLMKSSSHNANTAAASSSLADEVMARNHMKKNLNFQDTTSSPLSSSSFSNNESNQRHHDSMTSPLMEDEDKNDVGTENEDRAITAALESEETTQLFEKIMYIVYRLNWEGIVGSSEEIWKVCFFFFLNNLSFYFMQYIFCVF
jgi:hypothetical protein